MNAPEWVKPALQGAAAGAVALAIVGFTWGGWVTAGTANQMAKDHAKAEVVAALVPICVEQSKADPKVEDTLMRLKETTSYQRSNLLMETGWATMPGSEEPNRTVAIACLDRLSDEF